MPPADEVPVNQNPAVSPSRRADAVLGRIVDGARRLASPLGGPSARLVELMLRPVYALYTRRLRGEVMSVARPGHVAVIMDGNRRWARRQGFDDVGEGHRRGAEKALELVDWCADLGIREVTLWALSLENLGRPTEEVDTIADVATESLAAIAEGRRRTRVPIRIRVIGRREPLPARLREAVEASSDVSSAGAGLEVTVALAYSGRDELVEAAQATVRDLVAAGVPVDRLAEGLTAEALAGHLYTRGSSDPDLIIRTSGEVRLSGFLPWQSVYSEYYFCDADWPAFRQIDFLRAIRTYQARARRFGH